MTAAIHQPDATRRRTLSRQARDAFPPMGVYAVRDRASGLVRVGCARDVHARLGRIQFELRLGTHPDRELQAAWRQDAARFSFEVLELVKQRTDPAFDHAGELRVLEQLYRDELCAGAAR
ncbi:GIY-YIG nuclease family protein [Ramlibacter sp. RBP-2]|uniref:GIY-YIG nuclease family protein n=1 Tax=Ramlibacter lithotrophicus TaxID=2606681 RepID=A0A7X6DJN6_9BURK|nr:GIY-YIG nuclease family protein [Ramlibacter lithotrophicus]NKE68407.1 GIY-YIG nuclease family protein [Ramlibacter lithotrophicus]